MCGMPTLVAVAEETRTAFADEAIQHLDTLYRGALRLTRDSTQAEDLVQDTYVRALRYQGSYRPGTNMKAWLFAIMRNLFWDRFKGGRPEDLSLDGDDEHSLYDTLEDDGAGPEETALDRLAADEVIEAVDTLPEIHREVVLLVDVEGFSYKETADVLDVPIGTVMSRLHRARQQLQKTLYSYARDSGIIQGGPPA
jgi:RNA polymerase sigma-70 factor, ECF subfamily